METVLAKVLQASELPGSKSNQAALAIVADNRIKQFESFFSKPCIPHNNTSFKTKFFYDDIPLGDGEINPSWQLRKGHQGAHIQIYRWQTFYKTKNLKKNSCIAVIRPVKNELHDFYFYIYENNKDLSLILNKLNGTGAQFIKYQFGANKKAKIITNTPSISQINKSKKVARKNIAGENSAIEKHAEMISEKYLKSKNFKNFKYLGKPYDILCDDGKTELRVEVKGTKGVGNKVGITRNEILHSRDEYPPKHNKNTKVILAVVNNIQTKLVNDKWIANGGKLVHIDIMYFKEDIKGMFKNSRIKPLTFDFEIKNHKKNL